MWSRSRVLGGLATAAVLSAVAACGASKMSGPVAPSPTGGATILGLVNSSVNGMVVAAEGTNLSTPINSSRQFQLTGVPAGNVRLRFSATGVNAVATLPNVAAAQTVHVTVDVSGSTATIVSDERDSGEDSSEVEVKGAVSGASGTCPVLSFMVGTTRVTTSATTKFGEEGTCSSVTNGAEAEVEGIRQADGSIAAQSVSVDTEETETEVDGTVSGLSGTCPALSFMVGATRVTTSAMTKFSEGACGAVMNGAKVEVTGMKQADGSVAAKSVSLDDGGGL